MFRIERPDWIAALALAVLSGSLILPNLASSYLWQDEAQTAVIARTILGGGVPRGTDGVNYFSQEQGREYGPGHVWKWHTWLSFYVAAASLAVLGETTAAARLPFALMGVATVVLCYFAGLALWRDRTAAVTSGAMLALSVPFLMLSRQCRYYAAAGLFSLMGLHAYARLESRSRAPAAWLFVSALLLFHTHYIYCATLLASLAIHAAWFRRDRLRAVGWVSLATFAVNLPWIVWFADVRPGGDAYLASVLDLSKLAQFAAEYVGLIGRWLFQPALLLIVPVLALLRWRRGEPVLSLPPQRISALALVVLYAGVTVVLVSLLSPLVFYRYLAPLCAPMALLAGLLVGSLLRRAPLLGIAVAVAWLLAGDLRLHLVELRGGISGPIGGLVRFFEENAGPDDVVAISYGDMPLKFYTDLRVVGGLTGEDLEPARTADWIVIRHAENTEVDAEVRRLLQLVVLGGGYRPHVLDVPDTAFENREVPDVHRYRTAPRRVPRVVVFEREARSQERRASGDRSPQDTGGILPPSPRAQ